MTTRRCYQTSREFARRLTIWIATLTVLGSATIDHGFAQFTEPPFTVLDMNVGESSNVDLKNGDSSTITLLSVAEHRDPIRNAIRSVQVKIEIDGEMLELQSGNYQLPRQTGKVQVDCPITSGYNSNGTPKSWGLERRARLRVWPRDSAWMPSEEFLYPVKQTWFATMTQMSNEPTYVDGGERASRRAIYYHSGLDIGGSEGDVEVIAATDGQIVSVGEVVLEAHKSDTPVEPRADVVYLVDRRGWYYRYSHLFSIDPAIAPGRFISKGQAIGVLGKEGGSGGWSHLHFEIKSRQPSGQWGTQEGYAFLWEAYRNQHAPSVIAVARPHHLLQTGETIALDATKSWSSKGAVSSYKWTFTDGQTSHAPIVSRTYKHPGSYSEILEVRDSHGHVAIDFAIVQVHDANRPDDFTPPTIHAAYYPTTGIKVGQRVKFKVRSFGAIDCTEKWDFGDGSPTVEVHSDGNAETHNPHGYATTTHAFTAPGDYVVRVERISAGPPAICHLHVRVE